MNPKNLLPWTIAVPAVKTIGGGPRRTRRRDVAFRLRPIAVVVQEASQYDLLRPVRLGGPYQSGQRPMTRWGEMNHS